MCAEVAFVQHAAHRTLLDEILEEARNDDEVTGLILTGSVARGDAYPGSDLDIYMLLVDGCSRPVQAEFRQGILVERGYADFELARARLETDPMKVYRYLDGRILYDAEGYLKRLVAIAGSCFETYEVPAQERHGISHWLKSVRVKIVASRDAGDLLKSAYITSTSAWEVMVGLWAVNDRPIPPGGALLAHLGDLKKRPPHAERKLQELFLGDPLERIEATVQLIDWIVPLLDGADAGTRTRRMTW